MEQVLLQASRHDGTDAQYSTKEIFIQAILAMLDGDTDTVLHIVYMDSNGNEQQAQIHLAPSSDNACPVLQVKQKNKAALPNTTKDDFIPEAVSHGTGNFDGHDITGNAC